MRNTDKETTFIIKFTVCFVVAAIVLIGIGYAAINVIGSLDLSGGTTNTPTATPFVPTIDPQTTPDPTAKIIIPATPTPEPTPVPSRYSVIVNYEGDASSRVYKLRYTLMPGSDPINMDQATFSVWQDGIVYQDATYSQALQNGNGAGWSNSDGDTQLESGETFTFAFSDYALNIQPDTEPHVTFKVAGETIKSTTLPVLINPVITEEPPDPEATPTIDPFNPFYG